MVKETARYFLCGVGGSGMLPLALILKAAGHEVEGSDRALDQGRTAAKFDYLRNAGVGLHLQDGSGVVSSDQTVVASAAVEESVPDIVAARRLGAPIVTRAELLARLFNAAPARIGVAGTSGKSTTTAMLAWILAEAGRDPTVMNGAVMKNFAGPSALFASALVGSGDVFLSEIDESDGSITLFSPTIAVLNNIALDHKSMDELRALFTAFIDRADAAVLNLDNPETGRLAAGRARSLTFSIENASADYAARAIRPRPFGVAFEAVDVRAGRATPIELKIPGRHNVSNALAALAAAAAAGVSFDEAARALGAFAGVRRRLEYVGEAAGVVVIDDFAHNPDKIAASLSTLHEFEGRLIVMFQPHGYGPLKKMRAEMVEAFVRGLAPEDILVMPEPAYFGGTTDRSVSSRDIAADIGQKRNAQALKTREACAAAILSAAQPGDRIVVMGARDDTLTAFAEELLAALARKPHEAL
jgi:UDP-N-acetylmuramate--alanine ligase